MLCTRKLLMLTEYDTYQLAQIWTVNSSQVGYKQYLVDHCTTDHCLGDDQRLTVVNGMMEDFYRIHLNAVTFKVCFGFVKLF